MHHEVIVLGAGVGGIGAACQLQKAGVDYVVLEKANRVGGVWRENIYPGCACDVPSVFYCYSFAPNPSWSRFYGRQEEIRQYLEDTAVSHDVMSKIQFDRALLKVTWQTHDKHWLLDTSGGKYTAKFVIFACGPMHVPKFPSIPGLDTFPGEKYHSAQWDCKIDLTNKRVAVIGSGASAIQFVPEIQPKVKQLTLFQRTAPWVLPKRDFAFALFAQKLFRRFGFLQVLIRWFLYVVFELLNYSLRFPWFVRLLQAVGKANIRKGSKDPEFVKRLTPNFSIGCKRILQSNNWYPTLAQPNVKVVGGITKIQGRKLIASDGGECEVDVIIFGTGFEVAESPVTKMMYGVSGKQLSKVSDPSEGYFGTMMPDCPNAFVLFGPNLYSFSSAFAILEMQMKFVMSALKTAREEGIATIEVNQPIFNKYNQDVQKALAQTVWSTGCSSYFLTKDGYNTVNWPWTTVYLAHRLKAFNPLEFIVTKSSSAAAPKVLGKM